MENRRMKFRLTKRARGWQVQQDVSGIPAYSDMKWYNIRGGLWKWRFLASLHLTLLREMNRK